MKHMIEQIKRIAIEKTTNLKRVVVSVNGASFWANNGNENNKLLATDDYYFYDLTSLEIVSVQSNKGIKLVKALNINGELITVEVEPRTYNALRNHNSFKHINVFEKNLSLEAFSISF